MQDQGARNGVQKSARQSARLDIGLKGAKQIKGTRHRLLQTCKTDSTKMQHKGALHMRHMQKEGTSHTEGI